MKEYLLTLISVSIICGIIQTLAPDSASDGLKKHVKLVSSLCVLCIILAPVSALLQEVQNSGIELGESLFEREKLTEKYEDVYLESIGEYTSGELEDICEREVAKSFGIGREVFDVSIIMVSEKDTLIIDRSVLYLHKTTDKNDPRDISEYISALLECECKIIYA